jgi:hypothetical protein
MTVVRKLNNFNPENLPEDVKKNLQVLLKPKAEVVVIGSNYYEIYPLPAIKFLEVLKDLFEIIDELKQKKVKLLSMTLEDESKKEELLKNVRVEFSDILSDSATYNKIVELLKNKILEGVDEKDFEQMTTSQFIYLFNKLVEVNIENFPPAIKERLFPIQTQNTDKNFLKNQQT